MPIKSLIQIEQEEIVMIVNFHNLTQELINLYKKNKVDVINVRLP